MICSSDKSLWFSFLLINQYTNKLSRLQAELARLKRNVERREGREKAKGIFNASSISGSANGTKSTSTPRKCANCGEVGHIKTNKKYVRLPLFLPPSQCLHSGSLNFLSLVEMHANDRFIGCARCSTARRSRAIRSKMQVRGVPHLRSLSLLLLYLPRPLLPVRRPVFPSTDIPLPHSTQSIEIADNLFTVSNKCA